MNIGIFVDDEKVAFLMGRVLGSFIEHHLCKGYTTFFVGGKAAEDVVKLIGRQNMMGGEIILTGTLQLWKLHNDNQLDAVFALGDDRNAILDGLSLGVGRGGHETPFGIARPLPHFGGKTTAIHLLPDPLSDPAVDWAHLIAEAYCFLHPTNEGVMPLQILWPLAEVSSGDLEAAFFKARIPFLVCPGAAKLQDGLVVASQEEAEQLVVLGKQIWYSDEAAKERRIQRLSGSWFPKRLHSLLANLGMGGEDTEPWLERPDVVFGLRLPTFIGRFPASVRQLDQQIRWLVNICPQDAAVRQSS